MSIHTAKAKKVRTGSNKSSLKYDGENKKMIAFERRASTVLFNVLISCPIEGPFLLPANICPIVPIVLCKARRPFEFIDISPKTFCIDHDALVDRWLAPNNRPAGLIYVRTYGAVFDASEVFARIKSLSPDALIVDDRCLCPPEFSGALAAHTDIALYSTGYAKYVDIGFGGFGVLSDGITYTSIESVFYSSDLDKLTGQYKKALEQHSQFIYSDSAWLDTAHPKEPWEAYKDIVKRELECATKLKSETNTIYKERLPPEIQFPHVYQSWRFNIQVQDKSAVLDAIRREGFIASGHYDSLVGTFGQGTAPIAKTVQRHVVNLFNDRYFSPEQASLLSDYLVDSGLLIPACYPS